MRTLYDGSVGASYQSLPWGDGYTATVNNSYAGLDSLDFAGLERDVQSTTNPEEDTEHAQFRNYAPAQGRWRPRIDTLAATTSPTRRASIDTPMC